MLLFVSVVVVVVLDVVAVVEFAFEFVVVNAEDESSESLSLICSDEGERSVCVKVEQLEIGAEISVEFDSFAVVQEALLGELDSN